MTVPTIWAVGTMYSFTVCVFILIQITIRRQVCFGSGNISDFSGYHGFVGSLVFTASSLPFHQFGLPLHERRLYRKNFNRKSVFVLCEQTSMPFDNRNAL